MTNPERNKYWQEWYPVFTPEFNEVKDNESVYGKPNHETLALFKSLPPGSDILDVGGGDGRYALPLARMGHNVVVIDVDVPHFRRLQQNRAFLKQGNGDIFPVLADATKKFPFSDNSFDAVLNTGFAYLMPPAEIGPLLQKTADSLKPGGKLVFEFATNRVRKDQLGKPLIGKREYNYRLYEGLNLLKNFYNAYGFKEIQTEIKKIHLDEPYYLRNELIIASGIKTN